ncbi:hypothetical protein [Flexivirga sp. B27]
MGECAERSLTPILPTSLVVRQRGSDSVLVSGSKPGGLVIEGLTPAEVDAVLNLPAALRGAGRGTIRPAPSARWSMILDLVCRAAAQLTPGPARGQVLVLGDGPLPQEIARAVSPLVHRVVTEPEALLAPDGDPVTRTPDLVVLPAVDAVTAFAGRPWHGRQVPHLPVVVSGGRLNVGPLVRADTGPCLTCLDLHRGARDPAWAPWLASRAVRHGVERELDAAPELRVTAAALTALIVRGFFEDRPLPIGLSLSLERPEPRLRHHLWTCHPACCGSEDTRVTMNA